MVERLRYGRRVNEDGEEEDGGMFPDSAQCDRCKTTGRIMVVTERGGKFVAKYCSIDCAWGE